MQLELFSGFREAVLAYSVTGIRREDSGTILRSLLVRNGNNLALLEVGRCYTNGCDRRLSQLIWAGEAAVTFAIAVLAERPPACTFKQLMGECRKH